MKCMWIVVAAACACSVGTARSHVITKRWLDDAALDRVVDLISGSGRIHAKSLDLGVLGNGVWGAKDYSPVGKQAFRIVVVDDANRKRVRSNAENYFSGLSPNFGTGLLTTNDWLGYNRGLSALVGWPTPTFGGGYDMSNGRTVGSLYSGVNSYGEGFGNDAKSSYTGLSSYGLPAESSTATSTNFKKEVYKGSLSGEEVPAAQYTVKINHDSGAKASQEGVFGKKVKGKFSSVNEGLSAKYSTIPESYKASLPAEEDVARQPAAVNEESELAQAPKQPYPVEKRVPYTVEKRVPYPVEKRVPYPVEKRVPYPVKVPYPVPVQNTVHVPVPVHIVKSVVVHIPVPQPIVVPQYVPVWVGSKPHRRPHRHITHFRYF